jgi:hypothetical protein
MNLVAIGWVYVVLMMAMAEATSPNGTILGAVFTFLLYGVLPLAVVLYILGTPGRRRTLRAREAAERDEQAAKGSAEAPDGGDHATGDPVAAERKEP